MHHRRNSLLVLFMMLVAWSVYTSLSIARYTGYNVGMLDLGNMAQAIADAADGGPLRFTAPSGTRSRLSGHAELIYGLFALLYRLWRDPRLLLVTQATLFVSGVWPILAMTRRCGMAHTAPLFALGYLLLPTAVAAVLFDLHGDTLAMPLLLWLLAALAQRRWRQALAWAIVCLLCKWYIVAPVGLLGLTLLHARTAPFDLADWSLRRRTGALLCLLAGIYGALIVFGVHRWFATADSGMQQYASFYFGKLNAIGWNGALARLVNLLAVILPTALLWRWAIWTTAPALAIIVPAVITTGPGAAYAWSYHHYAAAVPFLVAGSIYGASLKASSVPFRRQVRHQRALATLFCGTALLCHVGLNDTPLGMRFWQAAPGQGLDASGYGRTSRDRLKDSWLRARVAPDARIAASNFLAPHLVNRSTLYLVRYADEPTALRLAQTQNHIEAAYPDALFDFTTETASGIAGGVSYDHSAIVQLLTDPDWGLVAARDGLLHFARQPGEGAALPQSLQPVVQDAPALASFGDLVELVSANVEKRSGHRYQATLRWRALRTIGPADGFPVSHLERVDDARIVHLPITLLRPDEWQTGSVLEERFEFELPAELPRGSYTWHIGWYDERHPAAALTDERSRVGAEFAAGHIDVP